MSGIGYRKPVSDTRYPTHPIPGFSPVRDLCAGTGSDPGRGIVRARRVAVAPGRGGVRFHGDAALLYRANLWLRTAVRVLRPVLEAEVHSPDELYDAVRTVNWDDYLSPDHTLAVDCNVRDSAITHSQYAARRVKDAMCDQFLERSGRRPSVDPEQPMVGFNLHIHRNRAILSLDSSWGSLHKRGYRPIQTIAPAERGAGGGTPSARRLGPGDAAGRSVMWVGDLLHRSRLDAPSSVRQD